MEVERRFNATIGKQSLYTINMYHTTCNCLVNGKQSKYFMDNDLKEIMSLMQHKIYGTSLEEVNDTIRDIVLKYYTTEDEEIVDMEVVIHDIVQEKTETSDLKLCTLSDIVETNIQFSYLHDEMTSVKKSAVVHGEITESQFDTIEDTTGSIKVTIENDAKKVEHRFQAIHDSLQNSHVKLSKLKLVPNGKDTTETIQKEKNNQPNPV